MANTGNPETDKLGIAEIEPVKGFLLGKTITAKAGISQEIFHNGAYYGSVLLAQASINLTTEKQALKMEARNGDVVISVHLGSYALIWDGELFTKDGYVQKYHAELQIHVVEPWLFATYCLRRSDPVRMAQQALHGALSSYAERIEHDAIHPAYLRWLADSTLRLSTDSSQDDHRVTGLKVVSAIINNAIDPRRTEVIEKERLARINAEKLRIEETLTQQRKKELALEAERRSAELHQQTSLKKTEAQLAGDFQELQDTLDQGRQIRQADFSRRTQAEQDEFERQEEAKHREFERQEETKRRINELREQEQDADASRQAQWHDVQWQKQLLPEQQALESTKRAYDWQIREETEAIDRRLNAEAQRHVRIEQEQQEYFELESAERKLLGQGRLNSLQRLQIGEGKEHDRHQETLQSTHKRSEGAKQSSFELELKTQNLMLELKENFLRQITGPLGQQIINEILNGGSLENIGHVLDSVFDQMQPTSTALAGPQPVKITQEPQAYTEPTPHTPLIEGEVDHPRYNKTSDSANGEYSGHSSLSGAYIVERKETLRIPNMGCSFIEVTLSQKQCTHMALDVNTAFLLWQLEKNRPAEHAQLQVGDLLIAINQQSLRSRQAVSEVLQAHIQAEHLDLLIIRGIKRREIQVELEQ